MSSTSGLEYLSLHAFVRETAKDKALGAIIGAAQGDCIGLYTEFLPSSEVYRCYPNYSFSLLNPTTPFRGDSHRDKFEPGQWTDDTDHALLILLSYIHNNGNVMPDDFAARLKTWVSQGLRCLKRPPHGLGNTIGSVAGDAEYLKSPKDTALRHWLEASTKPASNGSLMRTHPLGIICVPLTLDETFRIASDISITTHVDPRCVLSCCICTALIRGMLRGEILCETDLDDLCSRAYNWVVADEGLSNPGKHIAAGTAEQREALLHPDGFRRHVYADTLTTLELDEQGKTGYVYKCLGAGILTLRLAMREERVQSDIFERLITALVMQGGDGDTNACVAGALLGAWVGYSSLPSNWIRGMKDGEWLLVKAKKLARRVGISEESINVSADPDTAEDGGVGMLSQTELDARDWELVHRMLEKNKERSRLADAERQKQWQVWLQSWIRLPYPLS